MTERGDRVLGIIRRHAAKVIWAVPALFITTDSSAFSFLDHPSPSEIQNGALFRWPEYNLNQPAPITLTYAIGDDFLVSEGPDVRAAGIAAIENALRRWEEASRGMIRFFPSQWGAAQNIGSGPPSQFVGPPLDDWLDWFNNGQPDPPLPAPGWGAHIDFFSAPPGYSFMMGSVQFDMTECNLGFAAIWREGATAIRTVDIYLNEKWTWTDDESEVTPLAPIANSPLYQTPDGRIIHPINHEGRNQARTNAKTDFTARGARNCSGLELTVDLETVLVHEIGHAIGLDHPDEAVAKASQSLDAYLYTPEPDNPPSFFEDRVMHSLYTGVKRDLQEDEVGALCFLYHPAWAGDLDADGAITISDWSRAADIYEGSIPRDPWDINLLDFNTRNAQIDADEFRQLTLWILDPVNNPPGTVPYDAGLVGNELRAATTIEVTAQADPSDLGVGGTAAVTLNIDNPDLLPVSGWEITLRYDSNVLSNPRWAGPPGFLPDGTWTPIQVTSPMPGVEEARLIRLVFMSDSSPSGDLSTLIFDIDLLAADSVPTVDVEPLNVQITVDEPFAHLFAMTPSFPDETLNVSTLTIPVSRFDLNLDAIFDTQDLYIFEANPTDTNNDMLVDDTDREHIRLFLRRDETQTVAPGRDPQPGTD